MKNLLLEGCRISYGYKKDPEDWVGQVSIYIIGGGFGMIPHVVVGVDGDNKNYRLDELDTAIQDFNNIAFSSENLWFKNNEAMRILTKDNAGFDLEDPDDFRAYEELRLKLVQRERENQLQSSAKSIFERYSVKTPALSEEDLRKLEEVKQSPAEYPNKNYSDFFLDNIDKLKGITPSMEKTTDEPDETPDNN
jgi:hypothetical protein